MEKTLKLKISKKQNQLKEAILDEKIRKILVLGSVQSGKTYIICYSIILYAQALHNYDPDTLFYGAVVGWSIDSIKGNIVDVLSNFLDGLGYRKADGKRKGDYELKYGSDEKFLKLFNLKIYFFGFNTVLSFNKILGKPLLLVWVDEAARIYTQKQLQKSFDEFPGRQVGYVGHPFMKTIHSFNVEGGENHDYKRNYIDKSNATKFVFFPWDNPKIDTKEKIKEVLDIFPNETLRKQKIFNEWVVAEGKVFNRINKIETLDGLLLREIGLGIDYGSVNPTVFVPLALCWSKQKQRWIIIRLECYYHDPQILNDTPTTEYFSLQLRYFIMYLKERYSNVPITDNIIDSEASHFANRLEVDGIPYENSVKGMGSVDDGVQHLQSLFQKDYFYIYEARSITHFNSVDKYQLSGKDESLIEFENYQYDTIRSIKEGNNCYRKEKDHSIDATRYILKKWKDTGRVPIV